MNKELIIRLRNRDYFLLLLSTLVSIMIDTFLDSNNRVFAFQPVVLTAVFIVARGVKRYSEAIQTLDEELSFKHALDVIDAYTDDRNNSAYKSISPFLIKGILLIILIIGLLFSTVLVGGIDSITTEQSRELSELLTIIATFIIIIPFFSLSKKHCLFQLLKHQTKKELLKKSFFLYEEATILFLMKTKDPIMLKGAITPHELSKAFVKTDRGLSKLVEYGTFELLLSIDKDDSVFYKQLNRFFATRNWSLILTTVIITGIIGLFVSKTTLVSLLILHCILLITFRDYDELLTQTLLVLRTRVFGSCLINDHSIRKTKKPQGLSVKKLTVTLWLRVAIVSLMITPNLSMAIISQNYYWLLASLVLLYLTIGVLITPLLFWRRFIQNSVLVEESPWFISFYKEKDDVIIDSKES